MTIIDPACAAAQTIDTTGCPAWCEQRPGTHGADPEWHIIIHRRDIGEFGVGVDWSPEAPAGSREPGVFVPNMDEGNVDRDGHVSPAEARQLAADLIAGVTA